MTTDPKPFVITIARSFGSGGKYIGTQLSQKLNIPCYDDELKRILEEQSGIHNKHFQNMEENFDLPFWLQKLRKKPVSEYVVSPHEDRFLSDVGLYKMQAKLLNELASSESYVVMGKCANHVLRQRNNVMSIHVSASLASCKESICKKLGAPPEEAEKLILKTDRYRREYYQYYSEGKKWDSPLEYDFMLNSSRLGRDTCVEMILGHIKRKFGVSPTE
ncbi:MAG: cytidylate kinase-like family protein [Eubacteriales bacterium]